MGAFEDYSAALAEFERIDAEIDAIAQSLAQVGARLAGSDRARFLFGNVVGKFSYGVMRSSHTADGNNWKTAAQINEALSLWHEARDRVRAIWQALPGDQQKALKPPPESVLARRD